MVQLMQIHTKIIAHFNGKIACLPIPRMENRGFLQQGSHSQLRNVILTSQVRIGQLG